MVKLLHFADVHIGNENYGKTDPGTGLSTRVMDFLRRMDEMNAFAIENEVDLAIFAGDAFKSRNPNPTFQREFAWRIRDLAEYCPVVLLVGNHDLPINIRKASSVEIYETLNVPNVVVGRENKLHLVETKAGPVQVATVPYPVRARLVEEEMNDVSWKTIKDLDEKLQAYLAWIIEDLAHQADQVDVPRILTGHFTVMGAVTGSERTVMLGNDVAVMLSAVADPIWDYVALGHIHKHQNLTAGHDGVPPVVYSGSIERIDFGEEGDPKGFVWAEVERGKAAWEFIQLDARPFLTLRVDARRTSQPTRVVLDEIARHDVTDTVVRVLIKTDTESDALLQTNIIERELLEAGASVVATVQRDIDRPARARLGPTPEGLTPKQLMEKYFETHEVPDERIDLLLDKAQEIFDKIGD